MSENGRRDLGGESDEGTEGVPVGGGPGSTLKNHTCHLSTIYLALSFLTFFKK